MGLAESAAPFDKLAERYDALWSQSAIGRLQRNAVWRVVDTLFRPGDSVLDLGCGTGDDALHLMSSGVAVHGIDSSPEMVRIARGRGIDARALPIEALDQLSGRFDGAISNFGPLNCVARLEPVAVALARLIRPGGVLAVCVMGRFCIWETCHYFRRRAWSKACRRWRRRGSPTSIGVRVNYPSVRRLERIFRPYFRLESWRGIGLFVPPSYVVIAEGALGPLAAIDRRIAGLPLLRGMADHRLLVFTRI